MRRIFLCGCVLFLAGFAFGQSQSPSAGIIPPGAGKTGKRTSDTAAPAYQPNSSASLTSFKVPPSPIGIGQARPEVAHPETTSAGSGSIPVLGESPVSVNHGSRSAANSAKIPSPAKESLKNLPRANPN
jgi:hypothetical protein